MAQGMKEPQKEDLFRYDYGKPIKELIKEKGGLQNVVLDLFSKFCKGKYVNYLENEQVQGFAEWFEKNSSHVQKNIENMIKNGKVDGDLKTEEQVYYAIGLMIGGQYILGKYTDYDEKVDKRGLNIKLWAKGGTIEWYGMTLNMGVPEYDSNPKPNAAFTAFLDGLMAGLHEYAHKLRYFNGIDGQDLDELGVALATGDLNLPVFHEDLKKFTHGMRDPIRMVEQIKKGTVGFGYADIVKEEYLSFMLAPWIGAYLKKRDGEISRDFVLGCTDMEGPEMGVWHLYKGGFDSQKYLKGIADKDINGILSKVFENLNNGGWNGPREFFEKSFEELDKGFEVKPKPKEAPDGFVYLIPKKENEFRG